MGGTVGPTMQESVHKWREQPRHLPEDAPNILIVMFDDAGFGQPDTFGGEIHTPTLTRLADAGISYNAFHTTAMCSPTRAALMTGRYSTRLGLNTVIIGGTPNTLQASEVTLAELFKSQGYATAHAGKWHIGSEEQSWPTRQGFDEYHVGVIETSDGTLYRESMERSGMTDPFIEKVVPRIYESEADGNLKAVREYTVEYRHQVEGDIAKASVEFIQRQAKAKTPFFMYVGWTHSHYPCVVPPEFEGKFLHLVWRGQEYLAFAPSGLHRYHNQLLAHFLQDQGIPHHWVT